MAGSDRDTAYHLEKQIRRLAERPYEFGFYAALRLIECLYDQKPRLGASLHPIEDPIRIGQQPASTFEPASLTAFEPATADRPHRLTVRCFGLWGPNGPLPLHLTEYAQQRLNQHNDPTLVRFVDIFHHRMLSFFYRAWANSEPTVSFDRPHTDPFADYVGALAGYGMAALRKRDEVADATKFYYCGRFSCQTKNAEGLADLLTDYFQLPVGIQSFVGEWLALPARSICRLGRDPANGTLARSSILGLRVWGCQHKFRVIVGPLGIADFESLLPTGHRIHRLIALVRNYIGDELAWDLQLIMKREEVPAMRLSSRFRLGWTSWMGKRRSAGDAEDLVINVFALTDRTSKTAEAFR